MFHRAQFLIKNGDNVVAQRLLLRCLELNPFDSHRFVTEISMAHIYFSFDIKLLMEFQLACTGSFGI